jgi:ribonuclease H / adenosylcobalamin/alpha-ribazole phosphatase
MAVRWPSVLWIVRHGQSARNVASAEAEAAGAHRIALTQRDVDVPLSPLGEAQSVSLGRWFAAGEAGARPDVMLASPYVRSVQTAERFRAAGGCDADEPILIDERLREREFGILDGLTWAGVETLEPQQAAFRNLLGKFYHRPPGGESWADVIQRLRGVVDALSLHHGGQRVMIVAHEVVIFGLRYIIEGLDEAGILAIDRAGDVANCAVTEYRFDPAAGKGGGLVLARYNEATPLEVSGTEITRARESVSGARG